MAPALGDAYESWVYAQRTLAWCAVRDVLSVFGGPLPARAATIAALNTVESIETSWRAAGMRGEWDSEATDAAVTLRPAPESTELSHSALSLIGRVLRAVATHDIGVHKGLSNSN